jgi:hypothetical protein
MSEGSDNGPLSLLWPRREDPHYLLAADPARLVPHLDAARSAAAQAAAIVYRQSAHYLTPLDRLAWTSQLELTAHRLGCRGLAARTAGAALDRPWQTHWSHGHQAIGPSPHRPHQRGDYGDGRGLPDGISVIASGGSGGTVRVWRPGC